MSVRCLQPTRQSYCPRVAPQILHQSDNLRKSIDRNPHSGKCYKVLAEGLACGNWREEAQEELGVVWVPSQLGFMEVKMKKPALQRPWQPISLLELARANSQRTKELKWRRTRNYVVARSKEERGRELHYWPARVPQAPGKEMICPSNFEGCCGSELGLTLCVQSTALRAMSLRVRAGQVHQHRCQPWGELWSSDSISGKLPFLWAFYCWSRALVAKILVFH